MVHRDDRSLPHFAEEWMRRQVGNPTAVRRDSARRRRETAFASTTRHATVTYSDATVRTRQQPTGQVVDHRTMFTFRWE